ncbi:hypothetical protein ISF_04389 [Cordyceps fumosorosea ARSEF 2679]|uniref:Uncharacterized protein n=1 Tax=Cordyceps fumosorosea (strain ARSEF 2679) TaxID=1081104 RepID=A0A167XHC8_CORFA|nr:hypothetical protein ISF_04389 [Cordyceps fumosorosea ARSEF 2679]OAA64979.1 hypothetical protein ISF_04389 [Cordyceps fumosorosea ARSEF 2679]
MDVPDGVDPYAVRVCREHPVSALPPDERHALEKRGCFQGGGNGCSKSGWCFKRCDMNWSGPWCWTTKGGPLSDWKSCKRNRDCGSKESCGGGRCKDCGCSC